mgnify:FL=1
MNVRFYVAPIFLVWYELKIKAFISEGLYWVIRLGLEPKTPTLKVLCSTC